MNNKTFRAAVFGATGYTGQELVSLLARHPRVKASFMTSESEAGQMVPGGRASYVKAADVPLDEVDIAFMCLPHGEAGAWALKARAAGVKVVDLSADLRDGSHGAVYGLPELWRESVKGADLVANPGCYPTGILLGMAPLLEDGLVDGSRAVIVNAASGVTGAGRSPKRDLLYGEVAEDYKAYGVGNSHRHVPEIARGLSRLKGSDVEFLFTPHLLPVRRGILETLYVPVNEGVTSKDVVASWDARYEGEAFVEVWASGLPSLKSAVNSNRVALGASDVSGVSAPLVTVVAAFDNLVKGAAGQAVQNANLMLDLCEQEGLTR